MIIAIALYALAHTGTVAAAPAIINTLALGSVLESTYSYNKGVENGSKVDETLRRWSNL